MMPASEALKYSNAVPKTKELINQLSLDANIELDRITNYRPHYLAKSSANAKQFFDSRLKEVMGIVDTEPVR